MSDLPYRPQRSSSFPFPKPPHRRTLSSALRQYGRPSFLRNRSSNNTATTITRIKSSRSRRYGTVSRDSNALSEETESLLDRYDNANQNENGDLDNDAESNQADSDGLYPPKCTWTSDARRPSRADPYKTSKCKVWKRIHEVRREIINNIDDPYSLEQLKAPRMNISVVKPLVNKLYAMQDLSIVYCLLINRTQFIREQAGATHHNTVNLTRALLCELLAEKVLRRYNEYNPGPLGLLKLSNILVAGFEPFQGAPEDVVKSSSHAMHRLHQPKGISHERKMTALEIAIVSESKSFLASIACQRVVDAIYRGKVVYSPNSFIDIISDHWKRRPISLYDPRRGPLLNQYRLIVPRTRNMVEVIQFIILLVLYITVMSKRETRRTTRFEFIEGVFDVYAGGWVLDQLASILEHGWQVYTQNLWSFLDVAFSLMFMSYFVLRMHALRLTDEDESTQWATTSLDILSCAAPVLIPRLAFNIMSENMLFLSLRAMMGDFLTLTGLALWCFVGFLLSLKWLHNGLHHSLTIGKWMIWIWFGLDGTGIDKAPEFHSILGPVLMIAFAFLGNTLFLTILVSMLSNTFSLITANAIQEIQYRKSVLTFMGVKSDAIFAYMPPFNLLALVILLPSKWILSPRMFHKVHTIAVRTLNAPVLISIAMYERSVLWLPDKYKSTTPHRIDWKHPAGPRALSESWWLRMIQFWDFSRFSVHGDIQAVFDVAPPSDFEHSSSDENEEMSKKPEDQIKSRLQDLISADKNLGYGNENNSGSLSPSKTLSQARQRRKDRQQKNAILRREFYDPEDEAQASGSGSHVPPGYHRTQRTGSRDSNLDFENALQGTQVANVRLQKLETSLESIHALLVQLVGDGTEDVDDETMQTQLKNDYEAETRT